VLKSSTYDFDNFSSSSPTMSQLYIVMYIVVVLHILFLGMCMVVDLELLVKCEFRNWQR
jgi:hypothetical protein